MSDSTFHTLGLAAPVFKAITEIGFQNPTPVQQEAIPVIIQTQRDILALAQTGTGKTAAFGLPLLSLIDFSNRSTQALILCPTRELCLQITRDIESFSKYMDNVNTVAVYGGASANDQIKQIQKGVQIIIATPGRLMDLMNRKAVKIDAISYVVLDEADEMLNMGFEEDMEYILSHTPAEKRTFLFSATMSSEIRQIANNYLQQPHEITIGRKNSANTNISHEYALINSRDKYAALKRVLDYTSDHFYGMIFCTTKNETQEISDKLIRDGYNADCLHGDLSQSQREKVMNRFRHHAIKILLATDVAARGIDVSGITHVIHYHLPDDVEYYTHRSGRTARAGRKGVSFALITNRDMGKLRQIEKTANIKFEQIMVPSATEVRDKRLVAFIKTIQQTEIEDNIFDEEVQQGIKALDDMTKDELLKKMLSLELRRFSAEYLTGPDLNQNAAGGAGSHDEFERAGGVRLFVNIGSKDGLNNGSFKDMVAQESGVDRKHLFNISVKGVYSFINVDDEFSQKVLDTLNALTYKTRNVRAEISGDARQGGGSKRGGGYRKEGGYGGGGGRTGGHRRDGGSRSNDRQGGGGYRGGNRGGNRGGY
ncbi:MAG: DEAD/DEAH box helicase [Cytophagales bacterium]|nr:DEAD/DEAH box helicase [Cytophagales bacterium]